MSGHTETRAELGAVPEAELRGALEAVLGAPVATLERRPYEYQTSYAIDALDVRLTDGREMHLLFKDLGAPSETALLAKPSFLSDPLREIEVYREVLAGRGLGTAECFGAVVDAERGRYWLFLEHVAGVELWQVGELATWREVARWLAGLHTTCAGVEQNRLLHYDRALYETWLDRALAGSAGATLQGLTGHYETVVRRLVDLPTTFIHGELYPSNVLVDARPDGTRVCPIDWEMAAVGPGLLDLAALTAGWSDDERERIVLAYHEALPSPPPLDRFLEASECCRLHIALQWLGWAEDWSPPREHAQDWLAEALRAAVKLELF